MDAYSSFHYGFKLENSGYGDVNILFMSLYLADPFCQELLYKHICDLLINWRTQALPIFVYTTILMRLAGWHLCHIGNGQENNRWNCDSFCSHYPMPKTSLFICVDIVWTLLYAYPSDEKNCYNIICDSQKGNYCFSIYFSNENQVVPVVSSQRADLSWILKMMRLCCER